MHKDCSVVILAAGFSSRMKQVKFALTFDKSRTFLQKIFEEYLSFGCKEIILVLNKEGNKLLKQLNHQFPKQLRIILNDHPERERFFSLQTGIQAINKTTHTFIQNSDNPFVDQSILDLLFDNRNKGDYIVPYFKEKGGHPILISGLTSKAIANETDYNQNLRVYLKKYKKLKIESTNQHIIEDINTMTDYHLLFEKLP